jgi:predicted MFS family arabinose efflux permease
MIVPLRRNREYAALWVGQAVSNLGISISSFAYPLVVLAATNSAAKAGLVGSVLAGTAFVLRIPAGVFVDCWDRRRILILCDAGRALNSAVFAVALALHRFYFPHVLVVAFVEAALGVLFGPAESAAVRRVVESSQIREAVATNASRSAVPGLVGPPLGGVLLAAGRSLPFVADAVSYLLSLACVSSVRSSLQDPRPGAGGRHALTEVLDGVRWIRQHRFLRWLLGWFTGAGVVFGSLGLVILVLARNRGATPRELGAMFAITASGGLLGALATPRILRRMSPYALVSVFAWLATGATFALVVLHSPYAIGAAGAAAFLLAPAVNALAFAVIAEEAPDALQGRVTSAGIQLANLGAPVGPLLAGSLIAALGAVHTIGLFAGAMLALAVTASVSPGRLSHDRVAVRTT